MTPVYDYSLLITFCSTSWHLRVRHQRLIWLWVIHWCTLLPCPCPRFAPTFPALHNINVLLQSALHLAPHSNWNAAAFCFCLARDWPPTSRRVSTFFPFFPRRLQSRSQPRPRYRHPGNAKSRRPFRTNYLTIGYLQVLLQQVDMRKRKKQQKIRTTWTTRRIWTGTVGSVEL
jgi:hypothetical protein